MIRPNASANRKSVSADGNKIFVTERRTTGIVLALAAASFYGNVPVLARFAFQAGIPAIESIALRTFAVAVVMAIVGIVIGVRFHVSRAALPSFMGQVLATFAVSVCYLVSVQFIPVSLAVIIFFTFPVIVVVLSPVIEGHRPSWPVLGIALFALFGLYLSIFGFAGPFDASSQALDSRGLLLAAGASLGCALQFFTGRKLSAHMQPAAFASLVHLVILPFIIVVALVMGAGHVQAVEQTDIGLTGYLAMLGVSLAYLGGYFCHMSSLKEARASVVVPFFNFEPVVSTVMAGVLLRETLAANQYLGGAIVLASLILCSFIGGHDDTSK
jgi:drug/metabolite transporter (DMT)-like permease